MQIENLLRRIDTRDLEVLLTVAETGSFRRAGQQLRLGQSAVSRRIQKMEELLGVSLFERSSTGVRLTYAGSEFVACSGSVFENLKSAIASAQSFGIAENGMLRIGTMSSFSSGPHRALLKTFVRKHPFVRLCFVETERRQLMTMLAHRTLDAVISVSDQTGTHGDSFHVWDNAICLAVASDSSLAKRENVSWSEIGDLQLLISAREAGPDIHELVVRKTTAFGRSVTVARHQLSREGIMGLVGLGLGVTVVGDHAAGVSYPNVTLVPLAENETVPFSLTWRPENDNPALRRFISLARIEAKRNGALF
ncbi:MAG: LysR family transcriptional regulator [Pseudomonadota bacterium]